MNGERVGIGRKAANLMHEIVKLTKRKYFQREKSVFFKFFFEVLGTLECQ